MGLTRPRAYQIFDLDYKQAVRVVTTSNVTLSGGAPSQVDGVSLSLNDRVLVTGQSTGSQNGLYYVTTVGTGSNGTWARSIDGDQTGEIEAGMIVMVTEGTTYADTQWKLTTDDPIVIGTTALTFVQNYSANSISAGTSNVVVNSNANVTISAAGTPNVVAVTATGANVAGYVTATGNVTGNYILGNGALLTGVITSVANINSGTSNVTVVSPSGDITVGVGGTGNVGVFSTTGLAITGDLSVTGNATLSGNILGDRIQNGNTQIDIQTQNGNANITVGGVANVAVFSSAGQNVTGYLTASGNITASNFIGTLNGSGENVTSISATNISSGTLAQERLANSTLTLGSTTLTLGATTTTVAGLSSVTSTTFVGALTGAATTSGTVTTAAQPNITSVGTLSSLSVTGNITGGNISTAGQLKTTGTFLLGTQQFYAQGSDGFSVNENFNAGNANVTAYHYTSGAGRNAIVFDTAVTGQFTTGFGTTGSAASNKFVLFAEYGNTVWEWRKNVGISAPNLNGGTLLANISADGNLWTAGTITGTANVAGGNLTTVGQVSASGNISGNYFIGNGSQLTGIAGGDTIGGNLVVLTRSGNVNFAITAGYLIVNTRASGNVSIAIAA